MKGNVLTGDSSHPHSVMLRTKVTLDVETLKGCTIRS